MTEDAEKTPNRWAPFSNEELHAIDKSISAYDDFWGVGQDGQFVQEQVRAELERRGDHA